MTSGSGTVSRVTTMTVVIPTYNRPDLVVRCVTAVLDQEVDAQFDVVVVNDGQMAIPDFSDLRVTSLSSAGRGPAHARNLGVTQSSADLVVFTDDDAVPQPGWLAAVRAAFDRDPSAVGVVGRVESPSFDPLYEHSVVGDGVGNFLTCNVAYRRSVFVALEGFDVRFPHPHCEDRDLGERAKRLGPVVYAPQMLVVHPPRRISAKAVINSARFLESEWRLHYKHPQTRPPRWSVRWGPWVRQARWWYDLSRDGVVRTPRRALRFCLLAGGQLGLAFGLTMKDRLGRGVQASELPFAGAGGQPLRIAWVGGEPAPGGGVPGVAWLLLDRLAQLGCEIDCYLSIVPEDLPQDLSARPGLRIINFDSGWRADRWYSRGRFSKLASGLTSKAWARRRLSRLLVDQHSIRPYGALYQFSTIESFGLRRYRGHLPPIVIHPETHMAGELRAVRRERALASRCQPRAQRLAAEAILSFRARRQRRDIRMASGMIAVSRRFAQLVTSDYGFSPKRIAVLPNPIDLHEIQAVGSQSHLPIRIGFVGRVSARKGVDLVVALSHRLNDLAGCLQIDIVGDHTLWSDYRPLLRDLNPAIATYRGYLDRDALLAFLGDVDLLIQPATYEPFGLTVAEALARGVPVVVSNQVGAAEDVSIDCCVVVPAGDLEALEAAVRKMYFRVQASGADAIRQTARREAERLFAPSTIASGLVSFLNLVAADTTASPA